MAQKKIILTGDRPTGRLHLGHYVGSLKRRVQLQNSGIYDEINILIADDQALTDNADNPGKIRDNIVNIVLDYLSVGIDPAKSTICVQSALPALHALTFYYMNLVTTARLSRNPTVKAEMQMRGFADEGLPAGFFSYPTDRHDERCLVILSRAGVYATVSGDARAATLIKGLPQSLYNMPRNFISEDISGKDLIAMLEEP